MLYPTELTSWAGTETLNGRSMVSFSRHITQSICQPAIQLPASTPEHGAKLPLVLVGDVAWQAVCQAVCQEVAALPTRLWSTSAIRVGEEQRPSVVQNKHSEELGETDVIRQTSQSIW